MCQRIQRILCPLMSPSWDVLVPLSPSQGVDPAMGIPLQGRGEAMA